MEGTPFMDVGYNVTVSQQRLSRTAMMLNPSQQNRPMGPRGPTRSASPAGYSASNPLPNPRNGPAQPPTQSLSRSSTPSLSLQVPTIGKPKPSLKGTLSLSIPTAGGPKPHAHSDSDSAGNLAFEAGGYYGGPPEAPPELDGQSPDDGGVTITPFTRAATPTPRPVEPIQDLRQTLEGINLNHRPQPERSNSTSSASSRLPIDEDADSWDPSLWTDQRLEEISRLGEGAGGAVHKVRDRRTDQLMARKTITTLEVPMKQLRRELNIMASATHENITVFYGAYMSPSSSEVKILMEYCEGGSLEAVGKRIKDIGGRVGEKVAGRIAEGVRPLISNYKAPNSYLCSRSYKVSHIFTHKKPFIETSSHPTSCYPRRGL